ncbi:MAG: hypothetical protein ACD_10C00877G0001 [uncultured bacterium]|nr:MAG: hypothetical protein ACD_10C00877G0001 [uncultured bacterium]
MSEETVEDEIARPSVRVPGEDNPFVGQYWQAGGLRLPVSSAGKMYLPRIDMRELVEKSGCGFPIRYSERLQSRVEVFAVEEGFLVRVVRLSKRELHTFQGRLLERFGAFTVPFDFVCLPQGCGLIHFVRFIPLSVQPAGQVKELDSEVWQQANQRSDAQIMAYVREKRPGSLSELPEQYLLELERSHELRSLRDTEAVAEKMGGQIPGNFQLCDDEAMAGRISREPTRNSGDGGSLPTLEKLRQPKLMLHASQKHVDAVAQLHGKLPNFGGVIDYILRKLEAQRLCDSPIRFSPLLLVGDPGVGKSYFCRQLAEALKMSFDSVQVAASSQELHITGLAKSWASAGPSRFSEIMSESKIANPLIMVDEIDKVAEDKVQNALLQIFEAETAARWVDQYVEVPLDLSRVLFIATANEEAALSPVLLSRFEVFEISKPNEYQLATVFGSIYADEKRQFHKSGMFAKNLPPEALGKLIHAGLTPREARRLLVNAMELAIIRTHRLHGELNEGQVILQPDDMSMPRRNEKAHRIGFI